MTAGTFIHKVKQRFRPAVCSAFVVAVTGAGAQAGPRDAGRTFVYECADGAEFVVRLEQGSAWVFAPGKTVHLPPVPAASGSKYAADGAMLWAKGPQAILDIAGRGYRDCRNNPARAIWEDAKLRGVDFRATGNEPGWYLEISAKTHIHLVTDYGQTRRSFNAQPPSTDRAARRTTYTAQDGGHKLSVVIELGTCRDTMSGESFASTVTVHLDGKEFRGCGRALH